MDKKCPGLLLSPSRLHAVRLSICRRAPIQDAGCYMVLLDELVPAVRHMSFGFAAKGIDCALQVKLR